MLVLLVRKEDWTRTKLGDNYGALEDIRIISDTSNTSDVSREHENPVVPEFGKTIERKMQLVDIRGEPKNLDVLQLKSSESSEPSEIQHSVHRIYPGSDIWICDFCNIKADKHHFTRSSCFRKKGTRQSSVGNEKDEGDV